MVKKADGTFAFDPEWLAAVQRDAQARLFSANTAVVGAPGTCVRLNFTRPTNRPCWGASLRGW